MELILLAPSKRTPRNAQTLAAHILFFCNCHVASEYKAVDCDQLANFSCLITIYHVPQFMTALGHVRSIARWPGDGKCAAMFRNCEVVFVIGGG